MLTLTPFQALARENANELYSDEIISLIDMDDAFIYTIELDGLLYSVQIESNGLAVVSYMSEDGNTAYQSNPFRVDLDSEYNVLEYGAIKNIILHVSENEYVPMITITEQEQSDYGILPIDADAGSDFGSGAAISTVVENTFGSSYRNKLVKTAVRSYDKDYTLHCYESQSNAKLKNQSTTVAAKTAVSTIVAWLGLGAFAIEVSWFLGACGVAVTTINGIKCVASAFSADAYYYEISKTRNIKQNVNDTEILYSTWWERKAFFVNSKNGWKHTSYTDYKHSAYDNFDSQFNLAFDNLIYNF